jgi:HSP20 family protein
MELKQLAPWNWFKSEQESGVRPLPVTRGGSASAYPAPLARFHEEFDQLFDNLLQGFPYAPTPLWNTLRMREPDTWLKPSVDIAATDKAYTISAELPGVDEHQIEIKVVGDTLVISGQKEQRKEEKKDNYYCVECAYGAFHRQLSLPEDADTEGIQAACKAGVLTLTVPRRAAAQLPTRHIEVKVA